MKVRPSAHSMIKARAPQHTWYVLHQDTSGLSALVLLQISQAQAHDAFAVLPQQLQCTVSAGSVHTTCMTAMPALNLGQCRSWMCHRCIVAVVDKHDDMADTLTLYTTALTIQVMRQCTHRCKDLFSTFDIVNCTDMSLLSTRRWQLQWPECTHVIESALCASRPAALCRCACQAWLVWLSEAK